MNFIIIALAAFLTLGASGGHPSSASAKLGAARLPVAAPADMSPPPNPDGIGGGPSH